jgi:ubiquitin-like-conjugating enzyme ATG3
MADLVRLFRNTREFLTPVLKETAFIEKGVLTPEEFVKAGDQLILKCPTWAWQQGEESKLRPYLPRDKQFLIIRGCPSHKRVTELNASSVQDRSVASEMVGGDSATEDWCAPDVVEPSTGDDDAVLIDASDLGDELGGLKLSGDAVPEAVTSSLSRKDEYEDMEDDSLALDESTAVPSATISPSSSSAKIPSDSVLHSRRYDVSITYDNYYRTPRVWLFGYDENGTVLKPEAIFDDIMTDYARKTVTIDPHPHLSRPHGTVLYCACTVCCRTLSAPFFFVVSLIDPHHPPLLTLPSHRSPLTFHSSPPTPFSHTLSPPSPLTLPPPLPPASIHPCQHGPAMLRIIEALHECGNVPVVDSYLFIFLKFIQSVVPTIEYDHTMDVKVR